MGSMNLVLDQDILDFFNSSEDGYEYDIVQGRVESLCDKTDVARFGARFMPAFYYTIFLLSLLGNGLVLFILHRYEKINTVTNIFLLNLVLSGLLFALSLPFWASYHSSQWLFGRVLCKLVGAIYFVGFYSSILFLTLMTLDRYLAVVHAVTAVRKRRKVYAIFSSALVWALSLLATTKEFVFYNVQDVEGYGLLCEETGFTVDVLTRWKLIGYYRQFVLFFLLPLLVVFYCYVRIVLRIFNTRMRERCRAVKLILLIVIAFFLCWTPYNVVLMLKARRLWRMGECNNGLDYAEYITRNLAYLYCCVSPGFYTFLGKKFQTHLRSLLAHRFPYLRSQSSQSSRTTSFRSPSLYENY